MNPLEHLLPKRNQVKEFFVIERSRTYEYEDHGSRSYTMWVSERPTGFTTLFERAKRFKEKEAIDWLLKRQPNMGVRGSVNGWRELKAVRYRVVRHIEVVAYQMDTNIREKVNESMRELALSGRT